MHMHRRLQTVYFWSYNTSTFNAIRFDENPFTGQCVKESKNGGVLKFGTFVGRFQVTSWQ